MDLRVTTPEQAKEFVDDVGFCFLFPIQGIEMPSLWDAIAGRVVKTYSSHSGYEIERTWGWKDDSLNKKSVVLWQIDSPQGHTRQPATFCRTFTR